VQFKLHAPNNTTVECVFEGGQIQTLTVLPQERMKDIINVLEEGSIKN
jgi:hypothetical protein